MRINKELILSLSSSLSVDQMKMMFHAFHVPTETVAELLDIPVETVKEYNYVEWKITQFSPNPETISIV